MNNRKGNLGVSLKINGLSEHLLKYCAARTLTIELEQYTQVGVVWWICLGYAFAGN